MKYPLSIATTLARSTISPHDNINAEATEDTVEGEGRYHLTNLECERAADEEANDTKGRNRRPTASEARRALFKTTVRTQASRTMRIRRR